MCDTVKIGGVSNDEIRRRLFPFSLRDKARAWLQGQPKDSLTTWEEVARAFSNKYFPPTKTAKCRNDILMFVQLDFESLYEAWERYNDLLRKCPNHELLKWQQLQIFYMGIHSSTKAMIDAASGGSITNKSLDEAYELINSMASNNYSDRSAPRKAAGVFEVDQAVALAVQMSTLQQQMNQMMSVINAPTKICNLCGGGHFAQDCQEGNPFAQP